MSDTNESVVRVEQLGSKAHLHSTSLFDKEALNGLVNPDDITTASIAFGTEMYGLVTSYITETSSRADSFELKIGGQKKKCGGRAPTSRSTHAALGLGIFPFEFKGTQIVAAHGALGEPVGTDCGPAIMQTLTLIVPGRGNMNVLQAFGDFLLERADQTDQKSFTVYRWQVQHQYWRRDTTVTARPIDSVVLPSASKDRIVDDLADFLSDETYSWYVEHGIPYKRAYLFHGAPGAGKTSLIQALAGKYQRNVCYLSPTHPDMTDDNLKSAVQNVPSNSILVLEDIDALFGSKREKKVEKSPLTFSGLLNAIDGVGGATGQIFILTTNHREQLDPALIRNGRVDMHVGFADADEEQMRMLFSQFYPEAGVELGERFAEKLTEALQGETVSMAALQHYFIVKRKRSAEEAADDVAEIVKEKQERKLQKDEAEAKAAAKGDEKGEGGESPQAEEEEKEKKEKKGKAADAEAEESPAGGVHVHVHLPTKK